MKIYSVQNSYKPVFGATLTYKPAVTDKNLIEYEKNDFISGIYYTDILYKDNIRLKKEKINFYMNDNTVNDYNSKIFVQKLNDAPYKFATIVKKLDMQNKKTFINNSFPEIFKNVSEEEIKEKLDTLSYSIRDNYTKFKDNEVTVNIGGKPIKVEYIGKGENSIVCKLSDNNGNNAALKTYINPEDITLLSIFGELALYQDAKSEPINNIPALYMANPVSIKVEDKTKEYNEIFFDFDDIKDFDGYKGGWTLVEFITKDTPVKTDGISFQEWLKHHKLFHLDLNCDNCIGQYITDIGGVTA